ncbi:YkgB [Diaporthe helianthi]|uniref:YkgB n=1 Tax=Diaporthe helianthi TaxID=158607 RepID=A0A2P5HTQ6_DIAHE|nr:YkgB [Diaporthe helianthi]
MASLYKTICSSAMVASASAVNLYAAQSNGNLTSLTLTGSGAKYELAVTSVTQECKANPSVLTLDKENSVLYCHDRGGSVGTLNSFSTAADGTLSRIARLEGPASGVWAEILTAESGKRAYISASYNPSAVAVFELAQDGSLPGQSLVQTILPTSNKTGPIASRQDRSYSHQVIIDPTYTYVLVPDLGADLVRVFTYSPDTSAPLVEITPLTTDAGVGPRHGFFRVNHAGETFFFFGGELSQVVYSYRVTYGDSGLTFDKVFETPALGLNSTLPVNTAPVSECAMTPDQRFLIVSTREQSFSTSALYQSGPSDTLTTWTINEDGTLDFLQSAPSGGWLPRQFSLNKAGDLLAVGHQTNNTVVVWKRDIETGLIITEEDGGKVGQALLSGPVISTVWDE